MATLPAISFSAKLGSRGATLSWKEGRVSGRNLISMGATRSRTGLITLRSSRFRVYAAKPETLDKVMSIVKTQLALADDAAAALTPESKFTDLGADSLDTVEIVMALEEFKITVEEDNAQNITTVQEAADLIDQLVESKPAA